MKKIILILALAAGPTMASQTNRYLDFLDQNKDQRLSLEEIRLSCDVSKRLFQQADKNKDGELNFVELRTAHRYIFARCDI